MHPGPEATRSAGAGLGTPSRRRGPRYGERPVMKTALKGSVNRLLNAFDVHVTKKTTFYNLLAKEAENDNLRRALTGVGNDRDVQFSPLENFNHLATLSLTKRRQDHLASL